MDDPRWYLYVVTCADGTLYTGVTIDVARRVLEHNTSKRGAKYTRSRRPIQLASSWGPFDKTAAFSLEYRFKRLSRSSKLEAITSGELFP